MGFQAIFLRLKSILLAAKRSWEANHGVCRSELVAASNACRALCSCGRMEAVEAIFAEVFTKVR